jgi:hypothetical protein
LQKHGTSPAQACQCEVPDSWTIKPNKDNYLVFATRPTDGAAFLLVADPVPRWRTLDDSSFITSLKLVDYLHSFKLVSSSYVTLNQQRFFSQNKTIVKKGYQVYVHDLIICANGYKYIVVATKVSGDPESDSELKAAELSFSFISPPQIHVKIHMSLLEKLSEYDRIISTNKNLTVRLICLLEKYLLICRYIVGPLVGIVVLFGIGIFLWYKTRRKI